MFIRAVITVAVGYLLGNLNGAVWLSKMIAHDDVRCHGSGNAGFTNFCRNYGALTGLLVFVIDAAKAVAACILGQRLFAPLGYGLEGAALAAVAVGLGHDFPALLGFHGGKGIVCGVACGPLRADGRRCRLRHLPRRRRRGQRGRETHPRHPLRRRRLGQPGR